MLFVIKGKRDGEREKESNERENCHKQRVYDYCLSLTSFEVAQTI